MILDNELGDPIHSPPALQPYEPSSKNEKQKKKRGGKTSIFTGKKVLKKKRETERQERGEIEFQRGKKKNNLISGASGVIALVG